MHDRPHPSDLCTAAGFGPSHAVIGRGGVTLHGTGRAARERNHARVGGGDRAAHTPASRKTVPAADGATVAQGVLPRLGGNGDAARAARLAARAVLRDAVPFATRLRRAGLPRIVHAGILA
jgi:hypothetical protein